MLACDVWLRTDALTRCGYRLVWSAGCRWAVRGPNWYRLEPECVCGPEACPPHHCTYLSLEEAA